MATRVKYFVSELVAEVGTLPSLAAQVVSLTADPDCDLPALSRLILSDSVLSLRFLALANSAAFGHGQEIRDLRGALVRLGIRRVRNVALLMGIHDMTPRTGAELPLDLDAFWIHCLAVASCARSLAVQQGGPPPEDAWLVGILHGLGVNAMAERTGAEFVRALGDARQNRCSLAAAEICNLGFHHGELGARILRAWDLPRVLAEVIEFYPEDFSPVEVSRPALELIRTLRHAIDLARAIGYRECGDGDPVPELGELTTRLGLDGGAIDTLAVKLDQEVRELSHLIGLNQPDDLFGAALVTARQEVARVGLAGLDDSLIKEDLETQLAAAREIQEHILPQTVPVMAGFELAAVNYPSKLVSGDTYDFITLKDGTQGFLIADVAGKGMPAALLASTLQASIRALALVSDDPGALLTAANQALWASTDDERFATVFLAVLDPDGNGLHYASAGHNPPLLRHADGRCDWLRPAGPPLGMMPQITYPVTHVQLASGDLLVGYTDGITEAVDGLAAEFGTARLAAVTDTAAHDSPTKVIEAITNAVRSHQAHGHPDNSQSEPAQTPPDPDDDLTLLVVRKRPQAD